MCCFIFWLFFCRRNWGGIFGRSGLLFPGFELIISPPPYIWQMFWWLGFSFWNYLSWGFQKFRGCGGGVWGWWGFWGRQIFISLSPLLFLPISGWRFWRWGFWLFGLPGAELMQNWWRLSCLFRFFMNRSWLFGSLWDKLPWAGFGGCSENGTLTQGLWGLPTLL